MEIAIEKLDDIVILNLSGKLDSVGAIEFEKQAAFLSEFKFFIVDFANVRYLSSAGIRVILKLCKDTRRAHGKLILSNINQTVDQTLSLTGLKSQLNIYESINDAISALKSLNLTESQFETHTVNETHFHTFNLTDDIHPIKYFNKSSDTGKSKVFALEELNFSMGIGCFGINQSDVVPQQMVTLGNFIGLHSCTEDVSDFLLTANRSDIFLFMQNAVCFSGKPNLAIDFSSKGGMPISELLSSVYKTVSDSKNANYKLMSYILIADTGKNSDWVAANGLLVDKLVNPDFQNAPLYESLKQLNVFNCADDLLATQISVLLENEIELPKQHHATDDLASVLKYENIKTIETSIKDLTIKKGRLYLFLHNEYMGIAQNLEIEALEQLSLTDEYEIIVRKIYSDCKRITLNQLQGGFSASTYQVFGLDKNNQSILPTVLKLSNAKIIKREEVNFENYVKKFILNNATTVMGSFYLGDFGGIRYNFLGITGNSSLKWLRHVYNERTFEEVAPIFDKVYTEILKPWYGQPQLDNLYLYKEQNPINFFGMLLDRVNEQYGSPSRDIQNGITFTTEDQYIFVPELNREIINPYYFLKYEYPKREGKTFKYYKAICHGDLNLQNILLDEKENIYVIDFSETKHRNIVSDFARLEPIIKIEYFNINSQDDLNALIPFEIELMNCKSIRDIPNFVYAGMDKEVEKGYKLICKMREYAMRTSIFETDIRPYFIAMLEWTFPIVCYMGLNDFRLRYSMISAALICERLMKE